MYSSALPSVTTIIVAPSVTDHLCPLCIYLDHSSLTSNDEEPVAHVVLVVRLCGRVRALNVRSVCVRARGPSTLHDPSVFDRVIQRFSGWLPLTNAPARY